MLGAALLLGAPARAADPAELESKLTVMIDGVEKTLSLEEAQQVLHIPSVSLALIDQDSIAFARAYGENATPNTLYQAASLSKFVAAVGAMRLVEQKKLALDGDVNAKLTSWKVPADGFDKNHPAAEFLKYRQFMAGQEHPGTFACSPGFYRAVLSTFKQIAPLVRFLNEPLLKGPS